MGSLSLCLSHKFTALKACQELFFNLRQHILMRAAEWAGDVGVSLALLHAIPQDL